MANREDSQYSDEEYTQSYSQDDDDNEKFNENDNENDYGSNDDNQDDYNDDDDEDLDNENDNINDNDSKDKQDVSNNLEYCPKFIRLRGLPWSATHKEILDFLKDITVVNGSKGIYLVTSRWDGKNTGEAYVEVASQDDVEEARKLNKATMGHRYIEVFSASSKEAKEAMRKTNSHGTAFVVKLRGLPYAVTEEQIEEFFKGLDIKTDREGILFVTDRRGRATGEAFVQFETEDDTEQALGRNREKIGHRYIEIFRSSLAELKRSISGTSRPGPYDIRDRGSNRNCGNDFFGCRNDWNSNSNSGNSGGNGNVGGGNVNAFGVGANNMLGFNNIPSLMNSGNFGNNAMNNFGNSNNGGISNFGGNANNNNGNFGNNGFNNGNNAGNGNFSNSGSNMVSNFDNFGNFLANQNGNGNNANGSFGNNRFNNTNNGNFGNDFGDFNNFGNNRNNNANYGSGVGNFGNSGNFGNNNGGGGNGNGGSGIGSGNFNSNNGFNNGNNYGGGGGNFGPIGGRRSNDVEYHTIHMRGLPYSSYENDVFKFFDPIRPANVRINYNKKGLHSGTADAFFESSDDAELAMKRHRDKMGSRYIELFYDGKWRCGNIKDSNQSISSGGGNSSNNYSQIRRF